MISTLVAVLAPHERSAHVSAAHAAGTPGSFV